MANHLSNLAGTYTLANGREIPALGFGTFQTPDGEEAIRAVKEALHAGYRHIDTAAVYGNEVSVGQGIAESGVPRENVFVTTKLWNTERGYETALAAFDASLERLGLDYLDLYLIHWPANAAHFDNWEDINRESWRALVELYEAGRIRSIGVSNFKPKHLAALMESPVVPMVNQIEFHPGWLQSETVAFCEEQGILVEAWGPLGQGRVLGDSRLEEIAGHYGVSVAQLCVRWCLQHGTLPLPKSVHSERIVANADVYGFEISDADMAAIDALDFGYEGPDSDTVNF